MKTHDEPSRRFRICRVQPGISAIAVEELGRETRSSGRRKSMEGRVAVIRAASSSSRASGGGCLDDRPDPRLFSGFVIFQWFTGRKFPSIFCAALAEGRAGRLSSPGLRSLWTSSGRRLRDRRGPRLFSGFVIFQGFAGRKISSPFPAPHSQRAVRDAFRRRAFGRAGSTSSGSLPRSIAVLLQGCATLSASPRVTTQSGATRPSTAMGRRGSGPNEKSRGVRSRMRLRLQRNHHAR